MAKRYKMKPKASKKDFHRKAVKTDKRNALSPMRGGIRA